MDRSSSLLHRGQQSAGPTRSHRKRPQREVPSALLSGTSYRAIWLNLRPWSPGPPSLHQLCSILTSLHRRPTHLRFMSPSSPALPSPELEHPPGCDTAGVFVCLLHRARFLNQSKDPRWCLGGRLQGGSACCSRSLRHLIIIPARHCSMIILHPVHRGPSSPFLSLKVG